MVELRRVWQRNPTSGEEAGEADLFLVYWPETTKSMLFPWRKLR
jgi:hypothetical protein